MRILRIANGANFGRIVMTFVFLLFGLACLVNVCFAQTATSSEQTLISEKVPEGLVVTPTIIDEEAKKRDIFDYVVTLKNNYRHKVSFYTFVYDFTETGGRQEFLGPSGADRKTSLASWMTIKRAGTELLPGEEIDIPLNIKVGQDATAGKRYAAISFVAGSDHNVSEAQAKSGGGARIVLNFDVKEVIVEKAQLTDFSPQRNVFVKPPLSFNYTVENFGNREILPVGRMFIYDRRNQEVAEVALFEGEDGIEAGESKNFTVDVGGVSKLGKYKARIEIEYGETAVRDMQDTAYFWIIPMVWLVMIFVTLFVVLLLLTIIIFKRTYSHSDYASHAGQQFPEIERNVEKEHVINLRKK